MGHAAESGTVLGRQNTAFKLENEEGHRIRQAYEKRIQQLSTELRQCRSVPSGNDFRSEGDAIPGQMPEMAPHNTPGGPKLPSYSWLSDSDGSQDGPTDYQKVPGIKKLPTVPEGPPGSTARQPGSVGTESLDARPQVPGIKISDAPAVPASEENPRAEGMTPEQHKALEDANKVLEDANNGAWTPLAFDALQVGHTFEKTDDPKRVYKLESIGELAGARVIQACRTEKNEVRQFSYIPIEVVFKKNILKDISNYKLVCKPA